MREEKRQNTCVRCQHSNVIIGSGPAGHSRMRQCRRFPPTMILTPGKLQGSMNLSPFFPNITDEDWCAEFAMKIESPADLALEAARNFNRKTEEEPK